MAERINWQRGQPMAALQAYVPWREAVEKGDAGDLAALVALLRSDAELGPDARDLVADLLSRHRLAKRKGGQPNKAYRVTLKEGKLRVAVKLVEYYRAKGMNAEDAVAAALRDNKRDALEIEGDSRARTYSDEQIDEMITDKETDLLENRVRRGRK
ncbi:hypothetical protein [Mesorhizobium sp.]|uniref:hypothetical protein n=1 Tax=Mesorhizobium sp. TaxID=1871066 RepID=UPI0012273E86|nr:hypothetical protein [Mesorhizobium sp.]TIQ25045.1 MAG: hypothetical protein E5X54_31855 [Mesorhizobium sp.]